MLALACEGARPVIINEDRLMRAVIHRVRVRAVTGKPNTEKAGPIRTIQSRVVTHDRSDYLF